MIKKYENEYNKLMEQYKTYENFEAMEKFIKHFLITIENFEEAVESNDYEFDIDGDIVNY